MNKSLNKYPQGLSYYKTILEGTFSSIIADPNKQPSKRLKSKWFVVFVRSSLSFWLTCIFDVFLDTDVRSFLVQITQISRIWVFVKYEFNEHFLFLKIYLSFLASIMIIMNFMSQARAVTNSLRGNCDKLVNPTSKKLKPKKLKSYTVILKPKS